MSRKTLKTLKTLKTTKIEEIVKSGHTSLYTQLFTKMTTFTPSKTTCAETSVIQVVDDQTPNPKSKAETFAKVTDIIIIQSNLLYTTLKVEKYQHKVVLPVPFCSEGTLYIN